MFDRSASQLMAPMIQRLARQCERLGLSANQLTLLGFLLGIFAAFLIAFDAYLAGAGAILASRLLDALDGTVARLTQATDAGGFLDIALDFVFYASIPLAFALHDPATNALPAALLLASFIGTGSSFLAFATVAAKRGMASVAMPDKSFYFLGGLTEATETIAAFVVMCLWPQWFPHIAYGFAVLCGITVVLRVGWGWQQFR